MAAAMAAKAVAKKRAGGHIKPVPFVAPELPWRSKPEVEKPHQWSLKCTHGGWILKMHPWRPDFKNAPMEARWVTLVGSITSPTCAICPTNWALKC